MVSLPPRYIPTSSLLYIFFIAPRSYIRSLFSPFLLPIPVYLCTCTQQLFLSLSFSTISACRQTLFSRWFLNFHLLRQALFQMMYWKAKINFVLRSDIILHFTRFFVSFTFFSNVLLSSLCRGSLCWLSLYRASFANDSTFIILRFEFENSSILSLVIWILKLEKLTVNVYIIQWFFLLLFRSFWTTPVWTDPRFQSFSFEAVLSKSCAHSFLLQFHARLMEKEKNYLHISHLLI